jgi:CheY-like chemotaxis protein
VQGMASLFKHLVGQEDLSFGSVRSCGRNKKTSLPRPSILLVGNDPMIAYLIERYSRLGGYSLTATNSIPFIDIVFDLDPAAVIFTSVDCLESAQPLVCDLVNCDIPVFVCSSITDEARAYELCADYCLLHPLTYDVFSSSMAARAFRM